MIPRELFVIRVWETAEISDTGGVLPVWKLVASERVGNFNHFAQIYSQDRYTLTEAYIHFSHHPSVTALTEPE